MRNRNWRGVGLAVGSHWYSHHGRPQWDSIPWWILSFPSWRGSSFGVSTTISSRVLLTLAFYPNLMMFPNYMLMLSCFKSDFNYGIWIGLEFLLFLCFMCGTHLKITQHDVEETQFIKICKIWIVWAWLWGSPADSLLTAPYLGLI